MTNNVTAVAAGYDDTLFVRNDGTLWAVGFNESGQLGGDATYADTNRPVAGGEQRGSPWRQA